MKVYIVVDTDGVRLKENMRILGDYGKVFDARNFPEMNQIQEREGHVDAVFLATSVPSIKDTVIRIRQQLTNKKEAPDVFLIGQTSPDVLWDLLASGVRNVTNHPINPDDVGLRNKLPSVYDGGGDQIPLQFGTVQQATSKKLILVCSAKGGEGKTTISTQVAAVLAVITKQAVLIDSDYAGNVARKLGINTMAHSIVEFESDDSRHMDRVTLESKLVMHEETGLKVLCSPRVEITNVPGTMIENAYLACNRFYSNIVIDMHQGYTPSLDLMKDYATDIIFLCRTDDDQLERTMQILGSIYASKPDILKVIVNAVENDKEVQPIRVAMKELQINVPLITLPYLHKEVLKKDKLPVLVSPKKSAYSKELRKFLQDIGIRSTSAAPQAEGHQKSVVATEKDSTKTGLFIGVTKWLGRSKA